MTGFSLGGTLFIVFSLGCRPTGAKVFSLGDNVAKAVSLGGTVAKDFGSF